MERPLSPFYFHFSRRTDWQVAQRIVRGIRSLDTAVSKTKVTSRSMAFANHSFILPMTLAFHREMTLDMVGVASSNLVAPTKFGRKIKHLAETPGAFFCPFTLIKPV